MHSINISVPGNYSWHFKGSPYLDASYYPAEDPDGELIYRDFASLNHYFNLYEDNIIQTADELQAYSETLSDQELANAMSFIWNLRILEDEIIGECGSGVVNCSYITNSYSTPSPFRRRKRNVHSAWQTFSYIKVLHIQLDNLDISNLFRNTIFFYNHK